MTCRILLLLLLAAVIAAEDTPRQLDPAKPADAVLIIHAITEKMVLPRDQAIALTRSIETLAKLAQSAPVPVPPAPIDSPKGTP